MAMNTRSRQDDKKKKSSVVSFAEAVNYRLLLIETKINDIKGQGLTEYALIIGVMALVCIVAISSLGTTIFDAFFFKVKGTLETASNK